MATGLSLTDQAVSAVDETLHHEVMQLLKVPVDTAPPYPEHTAHESARINQLAHQITSRSELLETLKMVHTDRNYGPSTTLPATVTDGLYGMKMARPEVHTTDINLLSLSTLRSRKSGVLVAPLSRETLFPRLNEPHLSYSRTEVELYRACTVDHATATDLYEPAAGSTVQRNQTDWTLVLALPRSQLALFLRGTLSMDTFMHRQVNLWFTVRSAILRALHMHWQGMPLVSTENLAVLMFNPLKSRFSIGEVLTAPGTDTLYTFNRLYLDHCLTSGNVEHFPLYQQELDTAIVYELEGLTLQRLAPLSQELNCRTLYGYHCRGLIGHCVMTLSQGRMMGLNTDDMSFQAQFGTLMPTDAANTADPVPMMIDDEDADGTVNVTLGRLPLGHTVTVKVQMNH